MATGTGSVKFFNVQKGYGFIRVNGGGEVFVHFSKILRKNGRTNLQEGQKVRFDVEEGVKGLQAVNVEVIE